MELNSVTHPSSELCSGAVDCRTNPLGTIYAGSFVGDGSGLTGVGSGTDLSSWGDPQVSTLGPVFGNTSGVYFDEYGIAAVAHIAQTAEDAGNAANASSSFNDFFWNYGGQYIGTLGTPVGNVYTTCIGDSDHFIPSVFSDYIKANRINSQSFVCYTAMTLPDSAQCGTIVYSRHAGGHFYGLTDDGWKQLDN